MFTNKIYGKLSTITIYFSDVVTVDDQPIQYTLPTATSTTLGGVKPVAKTDAMTQDVGVDENGKLYTEPAEGGVTPDIQIGTVTTLDAGSDATASMSGTTENPLLNLGIPKGENGLPGHTPEITAEKSGKVTTIKADGTAIAEISDGSDGAPGADYVLTDADKTEIAEDVILGGIEAQLGDEPLPAPTVALVGQFIRAKTVVDGKITETEAADVSGGGGGETWELVGSQDVAEDVLSVSFDIPAFEKIMVLVSLINSEATTGNRALQVALNGGNNEKAVTGNANMFAASGTRSAKFVLEKLDGRIEWSVSSNNNGNGLVDGIVENMTSYNAGAFTPPSSINNIVVSNLNQAAQYFIGAGSKIRVFIIRE